jgi:hypothetical protein
VWKVLTSKKLVKNRKTRKKYWEKVTDKNKYEDKDRGSVKAMLYGTTQEKDQPAHIHSYLFLFLASSPFSFLPFISFPWPSLLVQVSHHS